MASSRVTVRRKETGCFIGKCGCSTGWRGSETDFGDELHLERMKMLLHPKAVSSMQAKLQNDSVLAGSPEESRPSLQLMKRVLIAAFIVAAMVLLAQNFLWVGTVPAKGSAFDVDPARDFHFEFGRGSAWKGLDTVSFGRNGVVTLFRQDPQESWQRSSLKLDADAIVRIFASVSSEGIMKMPAAYSRTGIRDGTQWILWIEQDGKSKAIYFNNDFPSGISRLAERIDAELASGLAGAEWTNVPTQESRKHENPLWNIIK